MASSTSKRVRVSSAALSNTYICPPSVRELRLPGFGQRERADECHERDESSDKAGGVCELDGRASRHRTRERRRRERRRCAQHPPTDICRQTLPGPAQVSRVHLREVIAPE